MTPIVARTATAIALAMSTAVLAACTGAPSPNSPGSSETEAASSALTPTTAPATRDVETASLAAYREVQTIDPVKAYDQPEYLALSAMCESVVRQAPDGRLVPGLATSFDYTTPRTLVLQIRPNVTFWDGKPLTARDVVFSLRRAADVTSGSFWVRSFDRVSSINATGDMEVTLALKKPDYRLVGELSTPAGFVTQQDYTVAQGKDFGTPSGGTMCTGAYKLDSWTAGGDLTMTRTDTYWDTEHQGFVKNLSIVAAGGDAALTSGLLSGDVSASYLAGLSSLGQLEQSKDVTVSEGPSYLVDSIVVSNLDGVLGDVRTRLALSLAMDRDAYANRVYGGHAQPARTLENPGAWGYGRAVFQKHWDALPAPVQDINRAKELIAEAGVKGQTLTIATCTDIPLIDTAATVLSQAAEAIGLKVKLKSVPAQGFTSLFVDPSARAGIDAIPTSNGPAYADPAAFYDQVALPGGVQNFSGFSDREVTHLLTDARTTANPNDRAELVAQAGDRLAKLLPWIPISAPATVLVTSADLTGLPTGISAYWSRWANLLGGI